MSVHEISPVGPKSASDKLEAKVSGGVLATSATALGACAVCCAVPLMLPAIALAGGGAIVAWMAGARVWLVMLALLAVAGAWGWLLRRTLRSGRYPRRLTLVLMGAATLLAILSVSWGRVEGLVLGMMR